MSIEVRRPTGVDDQAGGRRGDRRLPSLWILATVLWIAAPVLIVGYLTWVTQATQFSEPTVVSVRVQPNTGPVSRSAVVVMTWRSPGSIVAPQWNGTVQQSPVEVGTEVASGDFIARISNIDRIAYNSAEPFIRPLQLGDRGADVVALNAFLRSRGLDAPDTDVFTRATREAVRAYAKQIGAASESTFDPAWIVYLPRPTVVISSSEMVVGAPAPAFGTPIFETEAELASASLSSATSASNSSGDGTPTAVPAEGGASEVLTATDAESVLVSGVEIQLDDDNTHVAPEGLEVLRRIVKANAFTVNAVLQSPPAPNSWSIPSGAIVVDVSGTTCVIEEDGAPANVEILGESRGVAVVAGDLSDDVRVIVAPEASKRRCPG